MTNLAQGTFEVQLKPLQSYGQTTSAMLGRLSIDKHFSGDLQATSIGEMLSAGTAIENSAGYVAIEQVSGSLHGRSGSFALQHNGTMDRGEGQLTVTVVPDSGSEQLIGLTGHMTICISDGKHFYEFEYILPEDSGA